MPSSSALSGPSMLRSTAALLRWPFVWLLIAPVLAGLTLLYQQPHTYLVPVGTPSDQAYVVNFHDRLDDNGRPYRWSDVYGYVQFPGLGGGRPFTLDVTLDPGRDAQVTLIVNGEDLLSKKLTAGWQTLSLRIDAKHPSALASRDTVLEVRAPDYRTEDSPTEPKGLKLSTVSLRQDTAGPFIAPPYARMALFASALLLLYLFVGLALSGYASGQRSRIWALVATAVSGAGLLFYGTGGIVAPSSDALHMNITLLTMLCAMLMVGALAKRTGIPPLAGRLLGVCVAVGFGLRYGGMALPQSVIVDMPWHMKWLRTLLSGDWQSLYFPGGLSSVPREWGLDLLIPKSPLFYFAAAPLGFLPFELETLVKWLTCALDTSVIVAVFWLVLRVKPRFQAALFGAALYALMPLVFRSFAYGILPTIFAQWLATLVFVAALGLQRHLTPLRVAAFVLITCLALLAFPTIAVFVSMVLVLWAFVAWRLERPPRNPSRLISVPGMLVVAWLLALWAYYGIYLSPVITSAAALLDPKPGQQSTVRWPGGFPELLGWTADYVVTLLPYFLAVVGLAALFAQRRQSVARKRAGWLILLWASIAPIFVLVNLRMDMIGKHLFFTMAPVAAAGGVALWLLWRRGQWAAALAGLTLAAIGWQGLVFWIERLIRAAT